MNTVRLQASGNLNVYLSFRPPYRCVACAILRYTESLVHAIKLRATERFINNIDNNNNNNRSVYGAVITTAATARVYPVHLMNADCAKRPTTLRPRAVVHIHYRSLVLCCSQKPDGHFTVSRRVEG